MDTTELASPTYTADAFKDTAVPAVAPRFNMYQPIHKGLRAFMTDTLIRVGSVDPTDGIECGEVATQLRSLLHVCGEHLVHENRFLHAAMEQRAPGSAARIAAEHVEHEAQIASLLGMLEDAMTPLKSMGRQPQMWLALYQALSLFVAENFEHMLVEEREHNAVLWACFTDEELLEIHDALLASIQPDEMAVVYRWIVPQLSHPERVGMLQGMRQGMPAEVFDNQVDQLRPLLNARAWHKLQAALKRSAVYHG